MVGTIMVVLLFFGSSALALPNWVLMPPIGYTVGAGGGATRPAARVRALEDARALLLEGRGSRVRLSRADSMFTIGHLSSILDPELRRLDVANVEADAEVKLQPVAWHYEGEDGGWTAWVLVPREGHQPIRRRFDPAAATLSLVVPGLGQLLNQHRRGWAFLAVETGLAGGGLLFYRLAGEEARHRDRGPDYRYSFHDVRARVAWHGVQLLWVGAGVIHLWNIVDALFSPADPWNR